MLLPADKYDDRDVILEVECGAGGMESMMFAYELLTMYQNYAAYRGWRCEVNSMDHDRSPGKQGIQRNIFYVISVSQNKNCKKVCFKKT